jgi:hypothetical protein
MIPGLILRGKDGEMGEEVELVEESIWEDGGIGA